MAIGIGIGLPFNKRSSYPTVGLDIIVYFNSTYEDGGITYIQTSKGIGLPVISGTGLNRIIDFSPLNDVRFDKGSYVGNSYGLPATYNFPYVGIYYDATSEATRYYWKSTDFAYAVILEQSLLVDNMFFLKATATTDTSNVLATVDRLFIYSTALAYNDLAKMKTYIGIQNDFYGDNIAINGGGESTTDWIDSNSDGLADNWSTKNGTPSIVTGNGFFNQAQRLDVSISGAQNSLNFAPLVIGKKYILSLKHRSNTEILLQSGWNTLNSISSNTGNAIVYSGIFIASSALGLFRISSSGSWFELDEINIKILYQNYYAS